MPQSFCFRLAVKNTWIISRRVLYRQLILTTPTAVDGLATAAYAGIANDWWDAPITSMWEYGSVRSDDAYKGGGAIGDQQQMDKYEQFYLS